MIVALVFWLFLVTALAISWQAGDRGDRSVIVAIGASAAGSAIAQIVMPFLWERAAVALINLVLLVIVWRYALQTRRYWPIWFAGFQATGLAFGLLALVLPEGSRSIPSLVAGFWALPAVSAMVIGLQLDQRKPVGGAGTAE